MVFTNLLWKLWGESKKSDIENWKFVAPLKVTGIEIDFSNSLVYTLIFYL